MLSTQLPISSDEITATRIRGGGHDDGAALAALIARANASDRGARIDRDEVDDWLELGRMIVLEVRPNELAAACIAGARGVVFLVLDPAVASPALEQRMISVAEALRAALTPGAAGAS